MHRMLNMLRALKDFIFLGGKAVGIRESFSKKINVTLCLSNDYIFDFKIPEKELYLYIRVLKKCFPESEIRIY